jgi:uncharacterized membrane protein YciS (DUF1049 family)
MHIKNGQFLATVHDHFFEGYPVRLIVAWLIENVFWIKILVQMYALKGLAVPTLQRLNFLSASVD